MNNFKDIEQLYKFIKNQPKLGKEFALIFVFNSDKTIRDTIHQSECVLKTERNMIVSSFRKVLDYVYPIDGEQNFINLIHKIKMNHKYILVYSMAQNIDGIGRRCLIPLLCDFYELININANFMSSTYSDNKKLMYDLLISKKIDQFPKTIYFTNDKDLNKICSYLKNGKWVFKPNDESASIGVYVEDFSQEDNNKIIDYVNNYKEKYPIFCIQEFIDGREVAVPLLYYNNNYYCPGISEVIFLHDKNYLDYNNVFFENYEYKKYVGTLTNELINISKKVADVLNFRGVSRIDFRIKENKAYIEDIGSNPTVSETNGVNILFCEKLKSESSCIYELLVYIALIQNNLLIPSFD